MAQTQNVKKIQLKEGFEVFTQTIGEGDVKLLTLHGGPGLTHESFANFPEFLNPAGVQVIFYDQLGSFYSDQPDDPSLWKLDRFVDELHQIVQELEVENHFVLAHSYGSVLLIEYLLKYNTSFKGIILSGMPASFQKFKQNISYLRGQLPAEVKKQLEAHEKEGAITSPEYQQLIFAYWYSRHYCLLTPWPEPLMQMLGHLAVPVMAATVGINVFNFDGPMASWDRSKDLNKISIPTLFLAGKEDVTFEEDLEYMAAQMPKASYYVSPTGGHFCWWKDSKECFSKIIEFIATNKQV